MESTEPATGSEPLAPLVERGGAARWRVVGAVFFASLALALVVGFVIWDGVLRYERRVHRHVPADARLVVRWEVEEARGFEPFRAEILPRFEAAGRSAAGLPPRTARLRGRTGLELARDLRELALVLGPADGDWALLVGGMISPKGQVRAWVHTMVEEGLDWRLGDVDHEAVGPGGVVLAQLVDGTLVAASSEARLRAVVEAPGSGALTGRGPVELWRAGGATFGLPPWLVEVAPADGRAAPTAATRDEMFALAAWFVSPTQPFGAALPR